MKEKNKTLWKFVNNTGWILFKEIYAMLVSLVVGSLSARYLGPSNYGLLSYGSSFISFFLIVTQLGMSNVVILDLVRKPEKKAVYLGSSLLMRFIASVFSVLMIQAIITYLEPDNKLLQLVTLLQSFSLVLQATDALYFWFHAKMEMKYATITKMIALTLTSVWRITLLAKGASVEWFAASASISAFIGAVMITIFFYHKAKIRLKFSLSESVYILKNSYHFIINSVTNTFYTQLDKIMIGKLIDETYLGYYTAASTISVMWEILPNAILNSARPLFVQKFDTDKEEFVKRYQLLLLGITCVGIFIGIAFTVFAKFLVWILYGEDYYAAVPVLRILVWATVCSVIGSGRTVWLILNRQSKFVEYFTLMGAVLNITLNFFFIHLWGHMGAAVATLITNVFTGILCPFLFKETKEYLKIYLESVKRFPALLFWIKNKLKQK